MRAERLRGDPTIGILSATVLGFGVMDLGGPPAANEISDGDAGRVLNAVLDCGSSLIDTAVCYGTSETRIVKRCRIAGRICRQLRYLMVKRRAHLVCAGRSSTHARRTELAGEDEGAQPPSSF